MEERCYRLGAGGAVFRLPGSRLDPWDWRWVEAPDGPPDDAAPGTAVQALAHLAHLARTGGSRRLPVAVIGPREATADQVAIAEALGRRLGELGLTVVCGGKGGVMAAVSRGARAAGGLTVGLLPDVDWRGANADVALPIATGLSEARNVIIARCAMALVAVGGSYGTMTEVAYGLHFGKPVIGLAGAPALEGVEIVTDVDAAVARLADALLTLPDMS